MEGQGRHRHTQMPLMPALATTRTVCPQVFEPLPSWEEAVTFSLLADIPTYGCVLVACRSNGLLLSMRHILLRACVSACISVAWNTYLWRVRRAAPEGKVKET